MLCTISNKPAKFCEPKEWYYTQGCRCTKVKELHAAKFNPYQRARRGKLHQAATCPICGGQTYEPSGFCKGCEKKR